MPDTDRNSPSVKLFNGVVFFFLMVYIHPPLGYNHLQINESLSFSSTFVWSPTSFLRLLLGYHITYGIHDQLTTLKLLLH